MNSSTRLRVVQVDADDLGRFDGSEVCRCGDRAPPTIAGDQLVAVAATRRSG